MCEKGMLLILGHGVVLMIAMHTNLLPSLLI